MERISGPSNGSTPGNLLNGKTDCLIAYILLVLDLRCILFKLNPNIHATAIFATGIPIAFDTNGTLACEARKHLRHKQHHL